MTIEEKADVQTDPRAYYDGLKEALYQKFRGQIIILGGPDSGDAVGISSGFAGRSPLLLIQPGVTGVKGAVSPQTDDQVLLAFTNALDIANFMDALQDSVLRLANHVNPDDSELASLNLDAEILAAPGELLAVKRAARHYLKALYGTASAAEVTAAKDALVTLVEFDTPTAVVCPQCNGLKVITDVQFEDPESGTESFEFERRCDECAGSGEVSPAAFDAFMRATEGR
jgi:hypothetical protein